MATEDQRFAVTARSCALFLLLLLLAASFPAARSVAEAEVAGNYGSTSEPATEGPHGSSAAAMHTSELGAIENLFDGQGKPVDDECFEVCCWQGDPRCPYPYCNYNQGPCNGQ